MTMMSSKPTDKQKQSTIKQTTNSKSWFFVFVFLEAKANAEASLDVSSGRVGNEIVQRADKVSTVLSNGSLDLNVVAADGNNFLSVVQSGLEVVKSHNVSIAGAGKGATSTNQRTQKIKKQKKKKKKKKKKNTWWEFLGKQCETEECCLRWMQSRDSRAKTNPCKKKKKRMCELGFDFFSLFGFSFYLRSEGRGANVSGNFPLLFFAKFRPKDKNQKNQTLQETTFPILAHSFVSWIIVAPPIKAGDCPRLVKRRIF
jgi:hypothetical protein